MNRPLSLIASVLAAGALLVGCSSDNGSDTLSSQVQDAYDLTVAPGRTTWTVGPAGLQYPVSTTSGPFNHDSVPSGFEASPQGAVVAAITTQVFVAGADDETWPKVSQTLLEPGAGRDQWAQARALVSVNGTLDNPPVFRGFKIASYDPNEAVVTLAVDYPGNTLAAMPVQLSHSSGDWKVVLPTQDEAVDLTAITDTQLATDFVAYGPKEA